MLTHLFGKKPQDLSPACAYDGIIENDGQSVHASPDLTALAVAGWEIKQRMESLDKDLKSITHQLSNSLGPGASLVVDGLCRVTLSARQTMTLTDPEQCHALLGGRFEDLVNQDTRYTLSDALKALMLDPDHPLSTPLRECIQMKESVTVSFRPLAKAA